MDFDITASMHELYNKFLEIRNMEYVQSINNNYGGIGLTFEKLIGHERESFNFPDYYGVEVKTKRAYSKAQISLFTATPDGENLFEIEHLREEYGYPDSDITDFNVFNGVVYGNKLSLVGIKYKFKLDVDYKKQKVYLIIFNRYGVIIERKIFWTFENLKDKLCRKMNALAFISAWPKKIDNNIFYKYYRIEFYRLKGFEKFLELLKDGNISVTFRVGIFKAGKRKGQTHNQGVSFGISEDDLSLLFDRISFE